MPVLADKTGADIAVSWSIVIWRLSMDVAGLHGLYAASDFHMPDQYGM
jgi:hypothetical protein